MFKVKDIQNGDFIMFEDGNYGRVINDVIAYINFAGEHDLVDRLRNSETGIEFGRTGNRVTKIYRPELPHHYRNRVEDATQGDLLYIKQRLITKAEAERMLFDKYDEVFRVVD